MGSGTDKIRSASVNAQGLHLFGKRRETDINGGVTRSFAASSGLTAQIVGMAIRPAIPAFAYGEIGGRVGYRLKRWATVDVYPNSIQAPKNVGSSVHGGFGLRIVGLARALRRPGCQA